MKPFTNTIYCNPIRDALLINAFYRMVQIDTSVGSNKFLISFIRISSVVSMISFPNNPI